jgi:hypothetical protein
MRTVHETEALRPSDPVPKNQTAAGAGPTTTTPANKVQRIKLKLNFGPREDTEQQSVNGEGSSSALELEDLDSIAFPELDADLGFDEHELAMRPKQLYRLLRRQIHWAEIETAKLKLQWQAAEPKRKRAWREKEAIFDDVIEAEVRLHNALVEAEEDDDEGQGRNGEEEAVST